MGQWTGFCWVRKGKRTKDKFGSRAGFSRLILTMDSVDKVVSHGILPMWPSMNTAFRKPCQGWESAIK